MASESKGEDVPMTGGAAGTSKRFEVKNGMVSVNLVIVWKCSAPRRIPFIAAVALWAWGKLSSVLLCA